jgi:hypothetical protein
MEDISEVARQLKHDIMVCILAKTWCIDDNKDRICEIIKLLINDLIKYTDLMKVEYIKKKEINLLESKKTLAMYSLLLSSIKDEIELFKQYINLLLNKNY